MAKQMIYNNLIMHQKIWDQLLKLYNTKSIPHAMLLHGKQGIGKEAHAIELSAKH